MSEERSSPSGAITVVTIAALGLGGAGFTGGTYLHGRMDRQQDRINTLVEEVSNLKAIVGEMQAIDSIYEERTNRLLDMHRNPRGHNFKERP